MTTQPDNVNQIALDNMLKVAPKLRQLSEQILYGDVWERPILSKRDNDSLAKLKPKF